MPPFILKTFGGLNRSYYLRHLTFACAILAFFVVMLHQAQSNTTGLAFYVLAIVNTLLYPYSRFVYESVIGFIMGKNVFFVNALLMLLVKSMTMLMCWWLAIFIAPLGLAYLYWQHNRQSSNS